MARMSDIIEDFIKQLINETDGSIEIQRKNWLVISRALADKLCDRHQVHHREIATC